MSKMKSTTTFQGKSKPFGRSGHFVESQRHSLQARGIETGHLAQFGKITEYIKGGLGDYKSDSAFNKSSLQKGAKVELEHTNRPEIAKEIAKDHLTEDPKYYTKLAKMEAGRPRVMKIFYADLGHPSENKRYEEFYSKIHFLSAGKDVEVIEVPKGYFRMFWRKLPIHEPFNHKMDANKQLERIFAKYNLYSSNPYSSDNDPGQTMIHARGVHHTSMSIGDVIRVGDTNYIAVAEGFKKLVLT